MEQLEQVPIQDASSATIRLAYAPLYHPRQGSEAEERWRREREEAPLSTPGQQSCKVAVAPTSLGLGVPSADRARAPRSPSAPRSGHLAVCVRGCGVSLALHLSSWTSHLPHTVPVGTQLPRKRRCQIGLPLVTTWKGPRVDIWCTSRGSWETRAGIWAKL